MTSKLIMDDLLNTPLPLPDAIRKHFAEVIRTGNIAAELEGRRALAATAAFFAHVRVSRRRLDPRRLGDQFVERTCRRWIARSVAAGGAPSSPNA